MSRMSILVDLDREMVADGEGTANGSISGLPLEHDHEARAETLAPPKQDLDLMGYGQALDATTKLKASCCVNFECQPEQRNPKRFQFQQAGWKMSRMSILVNRDRGMVVAEQRISGGSISETPLEHDHEAPAEILALPKQDLALVEYGQALDSSQRSKPSAAIILEASQKSETQSGFKFSGRTGK